MSVLLTYLQPDCRGLDFPFRHSGLAEVAHRADALLLQVAHLIAGHGRKVVAEERLEGHDGADCAIRAAIASNQR